MMQKSGWLAAVPWILLAGLAGCRGDRAASCQDIPPGAIPRPAGSFACDWIESHAARAERDMLVIYQYEWVTDRAELGPFGQQHVERLAALLARSFGPIVVQPSGRSELDEARRAVVLDRLAEKNVRLSPEQVVVGRPEAEGLDGLEAPPIAEEMLGQGRRGGGSRATTGGSFGGTRGGMQLGL